MGYYILIFILVFIGLYFFLHPLFGLPSRAAVRNAKTQAAKRLPLRKELYNTFIRPMIRAVAALIRMKPEKEREMAALLKRAGMELTPREYRAKAIVDTALSLLLSAFAAFCGIGYMLPVTLIIRC